MRKTIHQESKNNSPIILQDNAPNHKRGPLVQPTMTRVLKFEPLADSEAINNYACKTETANLQNTNGSWENLYKLTNN
jgi:hypothetical protein